MRFGHVSENFASTRKTSSVRFGFQAWAAWTEDKLTFWQFWLPGAFEQTLLSHRAVNVDHNLWESWQPKTFGLCEEKNAFLISRLAAFTLSRISPPPPSETPVFVSVRLSPRLHESETPYSKIQICLATVMKTQRFAFCFPQWERALRHRKTDARFSILLPTSPSLLFPATFWYFAFHTTPESLVTAHHFRLRIHSPLPNSLMVF